MSLPRKVWVKLIRLRTRPVTSLGHQEGRRVFWEGPNFFFAVSNIFKLYPTHFSRGTKNFLGGLRPLPAPPLATGLLCTGARQLHVNMYTCEEQTADHIVWNFSNNDPQLGVWSGDETKFVCSIHGPKSILAESCKTWERLARRDCYKILLNSCRSSVNAACYSGKHQ